MGGAVKGECLTRDRCQSVQHAANNQDIQVSQTNTTIPLAYRVSLDIPRFDGRLGGDAQLVARWTLYKGRDEEALLTRVSIIAEASGGGGYERLIAAQNRALQEAEAGDRGCRQSDTIGSGPTAGARDRERGVGGGGSRERGARSREKRSESLS